jgi:VWFA-related protein
MKFRIMIAVTFALAAVRGDDSPDLRLLDLDVIAVDNHGQPVNDLTIDDFEVTDSNKPQKIIFFRHKDSSQWQIPKLALNEFSNRGGSGIPYATVILFDLMNEGFGTRGTAADHITKCLEKLDATDDVYLYLLTMEGRLFGVHGLTSGGEGTEPGAAPWNKQIKPLMDKALRDVLRMRPEEIDVAIRVQLTFAALNALGVQLSRVPGRKNVVWVTDGVPIFLGPVRSDTGEPVDFTPELRLLSEALVRSGVALYPVRQLLIGTPDRIGATSDGAGATYPDGSDLPANAARGGRNPGGAGTDTAGIGVQSLATLNTLADMTGGRESAGKDICDALKQAKSDVRISYQIGYYPPENNWNGKYHKLRVTCKRKGVRIQAKTGYFAWVDEPGAGSEKAIGSAASTEFDAAEIGLRGSLSADSNDKHAVQLNARIDARDIVFVQEGEHYNAQLRMALVGYLLSGRSERTKVFPVDLHYSADERDKALKDGIVLSRSLPLDELTRVRLIVYDRSSNAIGSITMPVDLPKP